MSRLRIAWRLMRGYRLAPWNSPYLRWRIETYWGLHAETITPVQCRQFMWEHRAEFSRFLDWAARMEAAARESVILRR